MVAIKFFPLVALAALASSTTDALTPRVHPGVHRALRQQGTVNLIVTMKQNPKEALNQVHESTFTNRGDLINTIVSTLENEAEQSQQPLAALLAQESSGVDFTSTKTFWISNQMYIEGASANLVAKLSDVASVMEVREEQLLPLPTPLMATGDVASRNTSANAEWGVEKVRATDVWASGNKGENIVVANIDTGVRGSHEALRDNFLGEYGWFDPEKKAADPYDNNGHGSHTMGTIAGSQGVGVAPGSKWMACKGCRTSSCPESDLLSCAEFITCPTDTSGANKDCSKAPHIISNSWGGGQGSTFYQNAVDTWQKAGIIPIFANGNSGPSCGTANSPADYANVIAVGSTTSSDGLSSFSSKGPATSGLLKPEISAPGSNVRSAWYTGDSSYNSISGTSMATPHVAGCVALMLSANSDMTYEQVREAIISTPDTTLQSTGYTCGGTADGTFPNNNYGYGRINVLKAITGSGPTPTSEPSPSPQPTTSSPRPTSSAPSVCDDLDFIPCYFSDECTWDWNTGKCLDL